MASLTLLDRDRSNIRKIIMLLKYTGLYMDNSTIFYWATVTRLTFCLLSACLMFYSILTYSKDIVKVVFIMHHFVITVTVLVLQTDLYLKRDGFKFLMDDLGKTFDYDSELIRSFTSPITKSRNRTFELIFHMAYIGTIYCNFVANFFSVLDIYVSDTFFLPYPVDIPFGLDNWGLYTAVLVWEEVVLVVITSYVFGLLVFVYTLSSHITHELDVLAFAIENTTKRIGEKILLEDFSKTGETEGQCIKEAIAVYCINQCVRHHLSIIKFYNSARQKLKPVFFVMMVGGMCVFVCTAIASIIDNGTVRYKFYSLILSQFVYLYFYCWFGESLQEKSENIRLAAYEIDWWLLPKKCQTSIRLIMVRAMSPMSFVSLMGQMIVAASFMDALKTSYSYFNMLLQIQQ